MFRLPHELKAELSLAQHKGSVSEKREARGAAERFGECGVRLKRELCCVQHTVFQIKLLPAA